MCCTQSCVGSPWGTSWAQSPGCAQGTQSAKEEGIQAAAWAPALYKGWFLWHSPMRTEALVCYFSAPYHKTHTLLRENHGSRRNDLFHCGSIPAWRYCIRAWWVPMLLCSPIELPGAVAPTGRSASPRCPTVLLLPLCTCSTFSCLSSLWPLSHNMSVCEHLNHLCNFMGLFFFLRD